MHLHFHSHTHKNTTKKGRILAWSLQHLLQDTGSHLAVDSSLWRGNGSKFHELDNPGFPHHGDLLMNHLTFE